MNKKNITLRTDEKVIQNFKIMAAQEAITMSDLFTKLVMAYKNNMKQ